MPQKVLRFTGINRSVSDFQSAGSCEELINIRPTGAGLKVVKRKYDLFSANSDYVSVMEHKFGATENLIVTTESTVLWVGYNKAHKQTIVSGKAENITYAGNVLLIKFEDGSQKAYKFVTDGDKQEYVEFRAAVPSINIAVSIGDGDEESFFVSSTYTASNTTQNLEAAKEVLASGYSTFYRQNPYGLAGPIIVGCTFELEDGTETWSSGFSIIDPTKDKNYTETTCRGQKATVYGAKEATLSFDIRNYSYISGIKNIKFYSSLPLMPYDMEQQGSEFIQKRLSNKDLNIDGQNMYLQKIVPFKKTDNFKLNTGYSLAANDLMPVTSGTIHRSGDTVSYNNRFHFYNSSVEHTLQQMSYGVHEEWRPFDQSGHDEIRQARLYFEIDTGEGKKLYFKNGIFEVKIGSRMDFVYPMGGIKQGYLRTTTDNFATSTWYSVPFTDSSAYNYSCSIDCLISGSVDAPNNFTTAVEAQTQRVLWKKEYNAINVSAQFNPFVFPVEYSYGFNGEIKDVATSFLPISSTQVGQYPITVFTTNGIYALEQGSGSVLYGSVTPLQPMVISGKATATPYGTFFVSSNNLYMLLGREAVNVSLPLNGPLETMLKSNEAYKALCLSSANGMVNFTNYISSLTFENFIHGATLIYDQLNNELIISNLSASTSQSYVFNLDTKQFHKISKAYKAAQTNSRYVIEMEGSRGRVVDLHVEYDKYMPILIQSRPLSLEALSTHIQRLILLVDAKLEGVTQKLCLSVFGSDNLYKWKCIISAQKQDTVLRQIRTNKAAKSYRDYIILINGSVLPDTDLSDIIADYTVVSRRLG